MLLGKRSRPPMRSTGSKARLSEGLPVASDAPSLCSPPRLDGDVVVAPGKNPPRRGAIIHCDLTHLQCSHFLEACELCNRGLGPGKDTFMYRGDMAFCSLECRQKQISMDEESSKAS